MNKQTFLRLCEQAERNESLRLARYLTWRGHFEDSEARATLWNDDDGLWLLVYDNETKEQIAEYDFTEPGKLLDQKYRFENLLEDLADERFGNENAEDFLTQDYASIVKLLGKYWKKAIMAAERKLFGDVTSHYGFINADGEHRCNTNESGVFLSHCEMPINVARWEFGDFEKDNERY